MADEPKGDPAIIIVWDRELVGEERYARLVSLLDELVRAEGGAGIERIKSLEARVDALEAADDRQESYEQEQREQG